MVAPDPEFPQFYQTILNKQEFIIHNSATRPFQYSLFKLPTMATIMTNLELDGIELVLTITSQVISKQMKWVMWYNKEKKSTSPQQLEEDHITLMTMRNIKAVCFKTNKRQFIIQCMMDVYEESNATIQARHPKLFKEDTYKFEASKDLLMCMPFDRVSGS